MENIFRPLVGHRRACPSLLLLIGCALICGCGRQGPERVTVSGAVTYRGQPLKEGMIRLVPMPGTNAPVSTAAIIDGRYTLSAHGGVPVGIHKIEIMAYRPNPNKRHPSTDELAFPGAGSAPAVEQYIPEKYNARSELEIIVPSGSGEIKKDFDLTD